MMWKAKLLKTSGKDPRATYKYCSYPLPIGLPRASHPPAMISAAARSKNLRWQNALAPTREPLCDAAANSSYLNQTEVCFFITVNILEGSLIALLPPNTIPYYAHFQVPSASSCAEPVQTIINHLMSASSRHHPGDICMRSGKMRICGITGFRRRC